MSTTEAARGRQRTFLPAAGHDWLLPLYDPLVKLLGGDRARRALLDQADLRPGQRALDIGCGTGTFAVLLKGLHPEVEVVGLDPDPKALARAARKALKAGVAVKLDHGFSDQLPYPDASFDLMFSSLMFHHLSSAEKEATLGEVRRVLKPGGRLHLLDFGGPETHKLGFLSHVLHSSHQLAANSETEILAGMSRAGLVDAKKVGETTMIIASLAYYQAAAR